MLFPLEIFNIKTPVREIIERGFEKDYGCWTSSTGYYEHPTRAYAIKR
jgi:hypothetical protein